MKRPSLRECIGYKHTMEEIIKAHDEGNYQKYQELSDGLLYRMNEDLGLEQNE